MKKLWILLFCFLVSLTVSAPLNAEEAKYEFEPKLIAGGIEFGSWSFTFQNRFTLESFYNAINLNYENEKHSLMVTFDYISADGIGAYAIVTFGNEEIFRVYGDPISGEISSITTSHPNLNGGYLIGQSIYRMQTDINKCGGGLDGTYCDAGNGVTALVDGNEECPVVRNKKLNPCLKIIEIILSRY